MAKSLPMSEKMGFRSPVCQPRGHIPGRHPSRLGIAPLGRANVVHVEVRGTTAERHAQIAQARGAS